MLALVAFVQARLKEQFNSKLKKMNGHSFECPFFLLYIDIIHKVSGETLVL